LFEIRQDELFGILQVGSQYYAIERHAKFHNRCNTNTQSL